MTDEAQIGLAMDRWTGGGLGQQCVHGRRIGEVNVTEGSPLVDPSFQCPTRFQRQFHKAIAIPPGNLAPAHRDRGGPVGIHGQQSQLLMGLLDAQAEGAWHVLLATTQGIAVAVEVAAADPGEIEFIQAGIDQSVRSRRPAARFVSDLLEHK